MQFISITEESARVGALLSGEVDIAHNLSAASIQTIEGRDDAVPFISNVAHSLKLVMASRRDPFTELKVRQAFRLIVDRQAMIDQAVAGYGFVGNDLMCPFDPMYASELPQREQDLDQARFLLEEAGMAGMEVTLDTAAITPGAVETAQLFAQHAQEAGVTVDAQQHAGRQLLQRHRSVDEHGVLLLRGRRLHHRPGVLALLLQRRSLQ